jgi:hypothetical protein
MQIEFSRRLLLLLIENVARLLRNRFGVNHAEGSMFEVVDLLKDAPELKSFYLGVLRKTLMNPDPSGYDDGEVPVELNELICHEMKWSELEALAEFRIESRFGGSRSTAISDVSMDMLRALDPNWENREFYRRYSNPPVA